LKEDQLLDNQILVEEEKQVRVPIKEKGLSRTTNKGSKFRK
jgi:hypothetical protein